MSKRTTTIVGIATLALLALGIYFLIAKVDEYKGWTIPTILVFVGFGVGIMVIGNWGETKK